MRRVHAPASRLPCPRTPEEPMHSAATLSLNPSACGACGASGNTVCHTQRFIVPDGYPLPSEYTVVICRRCGFVYADRPQPSATTIASIASGRSMTTRQPRPAAGSRPMMRRLATTASDIAALCLREPPASRRRLRHGRPAHRASRARIHSRRRTRSVAGLRGRVSRSGL